MTKPIAATKFAPGATPAILDFVPARPRTRHDGWSAVRQRIFIEALMETGSVTEAAATAFVSPQSAYRLRLRPDAAGFDAAWRAAQAAAVQRLTALAFERAIHGTPRGIWHEGKRVGEEYVPSDRLLVWLLQHFDRRGFGDLAHAEPAPPPARAAMPGLLDALADIDVVIKEPRVIAPAPPATGDARVHAPARA